MNKKLITGTELSARSSSSGNQNLSYPFSSSNMQLSLMKIFTRQTVILYLSGFLILINLMVSLTIIPLFIRHRNGNDFMIGLQTSVFALSSVFLRLYFGPLADSAGRKFPLVLGSGVFTAAPLLIWYSPTFSWMLAARIFQAVGMGTFLSAASSSIADSVPKEVRGSALGFYRALASAAVMTGPFFGYRLITRFGYAGLFYGLSLTSCVAFILLLLAPLHLPPMKEAFPQIPESKKKHRKASVSLKRLAGLFLVRDLRSCYLGIILHSVTSGIVLSFTAVFLEDHISFHSGKTIGPPVYFALFAAAGIVSAPISGHLSDRYGRLQVSVPLVLLFGTGLVLGSFPMLISSRLKFLFPLVTGFGYAGSLAVYIAWVVDSAPLRLRASALSLQESGIDSGNAIGIFIFGFLASSLSYRILFMTLGIITLLYPFIVWASTKKSNHSVSHDSAD